MSTLALWFENKLRYLTTYICLYMYRKFLEVQYQKKKNVSNTPQNTILVGWEVWKGNIFNFSSIIF